MTFAIGGISIALLVVGIVECVKELGMPVKGARVLTLVLGFTLVGLAQAITQEIIPADWVPVIVLVVTALAGSLAAMGYFDLARAIATRIAGDRNPNIPAASIPGMLDGVPATWPAAHHGVNSRPREPVTDNPDPQ